MIYDCIHLMRARQNYILGNEMITNKLLISADRKLAHSCIFAYEWLNSHLALEVSVWFQRILPRTANIMFIVAQRQGSHTPNDIFY